MIESIALSLWRIWTLVIKELLAILKDPKSRFVVVGPPILQFFVFGYAATFDLDQVHYAVLNLDRGPESRQLLARFSGSPTFRLVGELSADQEIRGLIDRQEARLVIRIPPTFARDLAHGDPARVGVILDGRNSNVAGIALGYINAIVNDFNASRAAAATAGEPPASGAPTAAAMRAVPRAWFNANFSSRWFIVSALGGEITAIVVVILSSLSVSRERESGSFDQLLVAPFRPGEILIGKALPPMVLGMADGLLLSAAAVLWYGVPLRGSLWALLAALAIFILCIVGVGLFISSLSNTMQQSLLGSFIFIMPAVILSGFTTPIENMPHWLQVATYANPLRYVVAACRQIFLEGADLGLIKDQLWPMLLIAAPTLGAAAWLFRHRAG